MSPLAGVQSSAINHLMDNGLARINHTRPGSPAATAAKTGDATRQARLRRAAVQKIEQLFELHVFETELGWMAALGQYERLYQLVIGCETATAAIQRLQADWLANADESRWCLDLEQRLQAYASGVPMSFPDVPVYFGEVTPFQRRVLDRCRRIPSGETMSYGELARAAGRPGAARAVGNVMASNRLPIVVPCHRVVHADGSIGHFSAPQGARLKQRMLRLEQQAAHD